MKKRLLITSIVMMLVVAVALSTATYAWFTANSQVSASTITLTAAVNEADALGIGWIGDVASSQINSDVSAVLAPMAPVAFNPGTTTVQATTTTTNNIVFKTQTTKQENSFVVFNANGSDATPVTYNNGTANAFYVKNLSNQNSISTITVEAIFTGDAYQYAPIMSAQLAAASTYYTKTGNVYTAHTVGDEAIANGNFALTADETFAGNKKYYTNVAGTMTLAEVTANAAVTASTYYELTETNFSRTVVANASLSGNDMIRVAIFKKDNHTGTNNADGYTLLGVLGREATKYTQVTKNTNPEDDKAFDKNVNYFTYDGDNYVAANITEYATDVTYYIAENTVAYGTIEANGAVKDLSYYKDVRTSLTLTTNLSAGDQVDIVAVAWLDGTVLDDTRQGHVGNVGLRFSAS